jgi:hypothetical protein
VLGLQEVHVARGERHGFPVEAAFQQQRAAGSCGALEALLQLGFEALVLLGSEVAVTGGVDERWMSMAFAAASMGERP